MKTVLLGFNLISLLCSIQMVALMSYVLMQLL